MRKFTILGRPAFCHDSNCADGFREDRRRGAIYGVMESEKDPRGYTDWESASIEYGFCAYCGPESMTGTRANRKARSAVY